MDELEYRRLLRRANMSQAEGAGYDNMYGRIMQAKASEKEEARYQEKKKDYALAKMRKASEKRQKQYLSDRTDSLESTDNLYVLREKMKEYKSNNKIYKNDKKKQIKGSTISKLALDIKREQAIVDNFKTKYTPTPKRDVDKYKGKPKPRKGKKNPLGNITGKDKDGKNVGYF